MIGRACSRHAFTLIELVLVLVILTVLATIAIEMVEPQVDQAKFEATQQTVAAVRKAILDERSDGVGRTTFTGFYADMGRLPQAFGEPSGALTLRELWDASAVTTNLPQYQQVFASPANRWAKNDANGDTVTSDSKVSLGVGWRGPYLQLPFGADRLYDGWGNALESDSMGGRLWTIDKADQDADSNITEDAPVTTAGTAIFGVRSFGRNNELESSSGGVTTVSYDSDLPKYEDQKNNLGLNDWNLNGTVTGYVDVAKGLAATAGNIVVQLYYPAPSGDGKIAIEVGEIIFESSAHSTYDRYSFKFEDGSGGFQFPIGTRVIKAYLNDPSDPSEDFGDENSDPVHQSIATTIQIFPGNTELLLTIN